MKHCILDITQASQALCIHVFIFYMLIYIFLLFVTYNSKQADYSNNIVKINGKTFFNFFCEIFFPGHQLIVRFSVIVYYFLYKKK